MLPYGYDPANYKGKIWWNENNLEIRAIWGTQADYDKHIKQGGTWQEYLLIVKKRYEAFRNEITEIDKHIESIRNTTKK